VSTKKEFKIFLEQIEFAILFEDEVINDKKELIIAKGYEKYLAKKSYKDTSTKIDKKKNVYAKKFANDSTLHINTHGLMLGISQSVHKQAMVLNTSKHLELACGFIRGKAKNQINYLKYLNKYHSLLDKHIDSMEATLPKIKTISSVAELMGIEGSISASYWASVKLVLEVPFEARITHGAKDIVNSSLNYAYAILYGKVQHSLVYAGLSLSISFLHALDDKKPTLTFDMIEEFRTFVVDRTIISMLNKDEPIKLGNDGLLTKPSRQLIAKNIKEKLGSYTMYKKESRKLDNIIQTQCHNLAKVVNGEELKYKAFIGKF
jgi:CRISPR-associated endonuclease Cas1